MANIINNNFNFYSLKINKNEYWDFILNKDMIDLSNQNKKIQPIAYFDLSNKNSFNKNHVLSNESYLWEDAYSTTYTLYNIGYTGFDNGLLIMKKDEISNEEFIKLYQKSEYQINETNNVLQMHFVNGCGKTYKYSYENTIDSLKLNGGFLQGFFKTECGKYEVLPSNFQNGDALTLEFVLKPCNFANEFNIINDTHPNNKGLFFYVGTRAENKWAFLYNDVEMNNVDVDIDEDYFLSDYIKDDLNIDNIIYHTKNNDLTIGLYEDYQDINNPFLLFDRTKDGLNVKNWKENTVIRYVNNRNNLKKNLFLLMNNTISGYNVSNIDKVRESYNLNYNIHKDLYENALGFRITDDGKIGYRYLIQNINKENNLEMVEGYSQPNMIKYDEWNHVVVKILFIGDEMFFKFYVNGNLIFISKKLPKLNLRQLDDVYEKQETVPYNISLGGGTQGLMETLLPNDMGKYNLQFPLEKYFAGTFIGYIKKFKIYNSNLSYNQIVNNFTIESKEIL